MFQRIQHFFNTLHTSWSEDPAARGAAKMAAGALLVVEGLFGVVRSSGRSSRNGKRQAGGIVGGVLGIVVGVVFIYVGGMVAPTMPEGSVDTTGVITDIVERRGSDGDTMYSPVITFETQDGQTHEFTQGMRSSSRPTIGADVSVSYHPDNPRSARRTDGMAAMFPRIFTTVGVISIVGSVFSLIISIALIVFGVILFRQGRADRAAAGETGGFFADLFSLATKARAGELVAEQTAAGQKGAAQGDIAADPRGGTPEPAKPAEQAAPAPAAPPAEWYLDPDDETMLRWWDGTSWTDLRKPRS